MSSRRTDFLPSGGDSELTISTVFQRDLAEPAQIKEAVRELADRVLADVAGRAGPWSG